MTDMERSVKRNMLKWHVGQEIFCPYCCQIMDAPAAVEMDFLRGTEVVVSKVTCASCYEQVRDGDTKVAEANGLQLEITDGRALFSRARRAS